MIKVQNNTATREPIPAFLQGLAPESLADLSWTDPALGVHDAAWLPEVDQSPALGQFERYGDETLTVGNGVVNVTRAVVAWSQAEIDEFNKPKVPQAIDMRQARLALLDAGLLSKVNDGIAAIKDAAARATVQIEWEYSTTVRRASPWIASLQGGLGLTDAQVDALFIAAAKK